MMRAWGRLWKYTEQGGWWWWKDNKKVFRVRWIWSTNGYETWALWKERTLMKLSWVIMVPRISAVESKTWTEEEGFSWSWRRRLGKWPMLSRASVDSKSQGGAASSQKLWFYVHDHITLNSLSASHGARGQGPAICLIRIIVLEGLSRRGHWGVKKEAMFRDPGVSRIWVIVEVLLVDEHA